MSSTRDRAKPRAVRHGASILLAAPAMVLLGVLAVWMRPSGAPLAIWWPATAIATGLLIRLPAGRWQHAGVGAVALSTLVTNLSVGRSPLLSVLFTLAVTGETTLAAKILTWDGRQATLNGTRDLGWFLLGTLVPTIAFGFTAGLISALLMGTPWAATGFSLFASHMSALLLLLPLLMRNDNEPGEAGRVERLLQVAFLALLVWGVFGPTQPLPLSLMPVAGLIWAALRCGMRSLLFQIATTGVAVIAATLNNWGPYSPTSKMIEGNVVLSVELVQLFLAICIGVSLAVACAVEDRRNAMAEIERLALHDTLTGAGNRRFLEDRLATAIARHARGEECALMLLDLDGFKAVNDHEGHTKGDLVLTTISNRLRTLLRPTDSVVRFGGDEFVLLLPGVQAHSADAKALVTRIVDALEQPIEGVEHQVGVSVGVTAVRSNLSADSLLLEADQQMYVVKANRGAAQRAAAEFTTTHDRPVLLGMPARRTPEQIEAAARTRVYCPMLASKVPAPTQSPEDEMTGRSLVSSRS